MELCKWTVDLGNLPSFQQQAGTVQGGFYTGACVLALSLAVGRPVLTNFHMHPLPRRAVPMPCPVLRYNLLRFPPTNLTVFSP